MALPNLRTTRELARLGANFASMDINNSHVTHSQVRGECEIPDKQEGSLLLPLQIRNSGNNEGTMPGTTAFTDSGQYSVHHCW